MFSSKKGFTLIELMIVIVILSVLMMTVVPKLIGAQGRSRDAGRVAELGNISAALQVYYDDNGKYPSVSGVAGVDSGYGGECLGADTAAGSAYAALQGYLKGNVVPQDPSKGANGTLCASHLGKYWYKTLSKNAVSGNSYIICSDAETYQKANTVLSVSTANPGFTVKYDPTGTTFEAASPQIAPSGAQLTADATPATASIYCVLQ